MDSIFSRTQLILGSETMDKLANSRVAVFGIGGVGSFTVEALARSGIGEIDLIDSDKVCISNLNRQIIATFNTINRYKVDVAAERIATINPNAKVNTYKIFFTPETSKEFDFSKYNYVVDAIDTVSGKIELIMKANEVGTPIISSMGTGNKLNPTAFEVTDIYKTSVCPLARVMRSELRKRGIKKLKVVYSKEKPIKPVNYQHINNIADNSDISSSRKQIPGSIAFVPSVAGLIIAGEVVKDIIGI